MRRYLSITFLNFCFLVVLAAGCDSPPTPAPAIAQPTTTTGTVAATASPSMSTATNVITLTPFVLHLPNAAPVLHPTADEWDNRINALQQEQPQLAAYLKTLAELLATDKPVAIIQLPLAGQELTLVAVVTPSDGLTLQTYLAAAQTELAQSRLALGSGILVENATIRYDLHEAHIPLATIQYTLPTNSNETTSPIAGYQVAMLDQRGTHLLLLTFVTTSGQPAVQRQIETILARLQDTTIDQ